MNRLVSLGSGLSLAIIAVLGSIDAARHGLNSLAALFGLLAVGDIGLTLGVAQSGGIVLRRDLSIWVERTSAVTGETPAELTSRAVSRLRAGFVVTGDDSR